MTEHSLPTTDYRLPTDQQIEQERRTLLVLARDQSTREQIEAAGRHVERLGRLLKLKEKEEAAGVTPTPAAPLKTA